MEAWQVVGFVFLALLPLVLMADFWPARERLDYRGRPLPRPWRRQYHPRVDGHDEHH
ncbi:hypothetical protein [Egicoccus halophilus]|uniref:Uncharacterized protein n=1 Tax=Egicoccus halophilus TaxID=1670830 RepID=A0A8J3EWC3_9ACTN|nr:hypothetical protein [Egicoccus halophilus]GGI03325.1 hypothetical protein GCM10011354_03470 [Egicoccus halophilus]